MSDDTEAFSLQGRQLGISVIESRPYRSHREVVKLWYSEAASSIDLVAW